MRLYLRNIPYTTTAEEIAELLSPFGSAQRIDVPIDPATGRGQGIAFADLPDDAAARAIEALHRTQFGGRMLLVSAAKTQPRTAARRPWSEHLQARGGQRDEMRNL